MLNQTIYERSDGGYCTGAEIWHRFEATEWTPCCWNTATGEEWVETDAGELLRLTPTAPETIPPGANAESPENLPQNTNSPE